MTNTERFGLLLATVFLSSGTVLAQTAAVSEPAATIEIGSAASWTLEGGAASVGPDVAVEWTPVEHWLEVEAGVSPLFTGHSTEWDADLLFKKPWTLSKTAELMIGVGPAWVHTRESGVTSNAVAADAVLDVMFWPSGRHRFGWFLEPGFEHDFGPGHENSVGLSAGLLVGIP